MRGFELNGILFKVIPYEQPIYIEKINWKKTLNTLEEMRRIYEKQNNKSHLGSA